MSKVFLPHLLGTEWESFPWLMCTPWKSLPVSRLSPYPIKRALASKSSPKLEPQKGCPSPSQPSVHLKEHRSSSPGGMDLLVRPSWWYRGMESVGSNRGHRKQEGTGQKSLGQNPNFLTLRGIPFSRGFFRGPGFDGQHTEIGGFFVAEIACNLGQPQTGFATNPICIS